MTGLIVFSVMVLANAIGATAASYLLGRPRHSPVKDIPYESGITPTGEAHVRTAVPYYLVAIFFILFDVEVIYLFPWGAAMRDLSWPGLIKAFVFIIFVFAGLIYIWLRGGLIWRHRSSKASKTA